MNSPFTGGNATFHSEYCQTDFRNEVFTIVKCYYICDDTNTPFYEEGQVDFSLSQVYNQYRVRHSIPFPGQIADLTESYGLSLTRLSKITGIGANQLRKYSDGEMPTVSNGKILSAISDPDVFRVYLRMAKQELSDKEYDKISSKAELSAPQYRSDMALSDTIYRGVYQDCHNGYAVQDIRVLMSVIIYLLTKCGRMSALKLSQLLLITDMLSYKKAAQAVTGLSYTKEDGCMAPANYQTVLSMTDGITITVSPEDSVTYITLKEGAEADKYVNRHTATLDSVIERYSEMSDKDLVALANSTYPYANTLEGSLIDFNSLLMNEEMFR